jgi:hypothetical protein
MSSVIVRLYTPLTHLFPHEGAAMPDETVAVIPCLICQRLSYLPPARMGVLMAPDSQKMFVVCGACDSEDDAELERKVIRKVSEPALVPA